MIRELKKKLGGFRLGATGRRVFFSILGVIVMMLCYSFALRFLHLGSGKGMWLTAAGFLLVGAILAVLITRSVVKPVLKIYLAVGEWKLGHTDARTGVRSRDEIGQLAAALDSFFDLTQHELVGSLNRIRNGEMTAISAVEESGADNEEDDEENDEENEITSAIRDTNAIMASFAADVGRIVEAARAGELKERCDASAYRGEWAKIAEGINDLMSQVEEPIEEAEAVVDRMAVNDYTTRMQGSYRGVFGKLAVSVNGVRDRLLSVEDAVKKVAAGDTSRLEEAVKTGKRSENDEMTPSLIAMMSSIDNLIAEVSRLTKESVGGNFIHARGDASRFEGGFRQIIEGLNETLDAISDPISDLLVMLKKMEVNDFTFTVTKEYVGDYRTMINSLEEVHSGMLKIQDTFEKISRGDIGNNDVIKSIGRQSEEDRLIPAMIQMMDVIRSLIDETTRIAGSAAKGDLSVRGDTEKFEGGYAEIVRSINTLLDEVDRPVGEISHFMQDLNTTSRLDIRVTGEYEGSFKLLADSVNHTVDGLAQIIRHVSSVITEMARGNFNIKDLPDYPGDYNALSTAINTILGSLNDLIGNIDATARQISGGSAQVAQGSQTLSDGAAQQASAVEELTASMAQISDQTGKNAENAKEARSLAENVADQSEAGNKEMAEMLRSMGEIDQASKNIAGIIKVIDNIAFQTNILALNAAVEAARAGQYGKGFAVVAQEVKTLAEHSASAAKETSALIESTVSKTAAGMATANRAADVFAKIAGGVKHVSDLIGEISESSGEQATGITQIDRGLQDVSRVVQTNSATSEESAAASEELSGQAEMLEGQVSQFTLREKEAFRKRDAVLQAR